MALNPRALPDGALELLTARLYATLVTLRPDGSPHAVPVGSTWDDDAGLARVITRAGSAKVRNLRAATGDPVRSRVALSTVDGGRWITLEGPARVSDDPDEVAEAVRRYAQRYRHPAERPDRVALVVAVDRVLGRV